jgi:hypothetical protein
LFTLTCHGPDFRTVKFLQNCAATSAFHSRG